MFKKYFLVLFILIFPLLLSGCKTGLFGEETQANVPPPAPAAPVVVDGIRTSYADVVEKSSPAVVRIEAEHKNRQMQQQQQQSPFGDEDFFRQFPMPRQQQRPPTERGMGSGVIASADGTILTNAHVVDGAEKVTVLLSDNKSYDAKVVGVDKPSDLAVLKIDAQNLPYLTLGNSDGVRVGDIVLAIGNPLGIGQSVTAGIISAKGRRTGLSDGSFEDFLQTDAPINRGNSGGALVNLNGELIGVNSQILAGGPSGGNIGIGFAIPSNMAKSVMEQLIKDGKVHRGMLGVNIQTMTEDTAKALDLKDVSGVIVSNVRQGSAAEKAGVKRGDIITAINGEKIDDGNVLRNKVASTPPGTEIKLTVLRDGSPVTLTATLDEFDGEAAGPRNPQQEQNGPSVEKQSGKLGLTLQSLTPQIAKQLGLPSENEGVVVTDVDQSGVGADAGITRGDVLLEVNRQSVNSPEAVQSALEKAGAKPILLLLARKGQTVYMTVRP